MAKVRNDTPALFYELDADLHAKGVGVLLESREADIFSVVLNSGDGRLLRAELSSDCLLCHPSCLTGLAQHDTEFKRAIPRLEVLPKLRTLLLSVLDVFFEVAHAHFLRK